MLTVTSATLSAMSKNALHLDYETFSACPIAKAGAYRYARHPTTEVLIASYWLPGMDTDFDEPLVWLPCTEPIPLDLITAAKDKSIEFWAHNAQFERAVTTWALRRMHPSFPEVPIERWMCTAALAAANGLARNLDTALQMLGTGVGKDPEGKRLIKKFSIPRKPTKNDPRTRIFPEDDPADFDKFVRYCQQDVLGELELHTHLPPMHPEERRFFHLDMHMNERGLPIDLPLVRKTYDVLQVLEKNIHDEVAKLTGGIKATQREKMLAVFAGMGIDLENIRAQTVRDELANNKDLSEDARRLLQLRVEAGKASTKKLVSMLACTDPDDQVVQGGFLFHGAHTGRYAGRLVQPQNFIRGSLKPHQQDTVFDLLELADPDIMAMLYDWPIDTISQCMRGFMRAPEGQRWVVVDYTAIEARVLAWVANEVRVLEAYRKGVDVYKMMASSLFNVPIENVDGEQRRLGKNLVLGCGYSLGGARFVEYCAGLGQVVDPAFAMKAVKMYRDQHKGIVSLWKEVEDAAADAIRNPGSRVEVARCTMFMRQHWFCIQLPSGREIRYAKARATPVERWGKPGFQISFMTEFHGKVVRETTYGGKLVENIVQGIARDVMREGMFSAEEAGYPCHGTVHDELLTLRQHGEGSHHELEKIVCTLPKWTRGIPLNAEGFECVRYRKG